jgi:hypothetical protein
MAAAHSGAGLADGEKINLEVIITATDAQGTARTARGNAILTYAAATNPVRVNGCYVRNANVGNGLQIDCYATDSDDSTGASLVGNWDLTTAVSDATIGMTGSIRTGRGMEAGDVANHEYTVTASNGTATSDPFIFEVPVDTHGSILRIGCSDATQDMLLQEHSVDAVSLACGHGGFNEANKPNTGADGRYTIDVGDKNCIQDAINALDPAERDAHRFYNGSASGDNTPLNVLSGCDFIHAQTEYFSNN